MASIPLPALDTRPPQSPDPMASYGRALSLRDLIQKSQMNQQNMQANQQEMQIRQQQIADQTAMTAAMKDWDGKDYDALAKSVLQHNGSANAATQIQQHGLTIKKTVSDIAKQDSETGSKNLETFINSHKAIGDALTGIENVPDDQLHQKALDTVGELAKAGILQPQQAQQFSQGIQATQDPKELRSQIDMFAKTSQGAKATAEAEQAKANLDKTKAEQWKSVEGTGMFFNPVTNQVKPPDGAIMTQQMADAKYRGLQQRKNLGMPLAKDDAAFVSAYEKQKTLVPVANFNLQNAGATGANGQPSEMAKSIASGEMKWQDAVSPRTPMKAKEDLLSQVKQINPQFNSGDFDVEKKVREKFTSGNVSDQLMAINTAREHMKTFSALADALDNGNVQLINKIGNQIGVQFGSDKATNLRIASQAFGGEVGKAFDGAGVVAGEREEAQKNFNDAMSKGQFKGAIQTVDELLAGKQRSAQKSYDAGRAGKPNFGGGTQPATNAKTLTSAALQQAAKDHGVSFDEAKRQAIATGYTIQ